MIRPKNQRGAALMIVLIMVASLAVVALGITQFTEKATSRAIASQSRDQAYWALMGAENAALKLLELQAQVREGVDLPTERWLAEPFVLPVEGAVITARFRDRSACFNINDLVQQDSTSFTIDETAIERFSQLINDLGGSANSGRVLAVAAADFIDSDGNTEQGGAEDYYYSGRDVPYLTASYLLADISELRAVQGWTAGIMTSLAPWLCAIPDESDAIPVNVNTLVPSDAPILAMALEHRVPLAEADTLISRRPADGYESVEQFLNQTSLKDLTQEERDNLAGFLSTEARLIEMEARVRYDGMVFVLTSLIEKGRGDGYSVIARRFGPRD